MPNITRLDPSEWIGAYLRETPWPWPPVYGDWVVLSEVCQFHSQFAETCTIQVGALEKLDFCSSRIRIYVDKDYIIKDIKIG